MFALLATGELSESPSLRGLLVAALILLTLTLLAGWLTARVIPNAKAGVVEEKWSQSGSVTDGRILALDGECGYKALLRGGLHFG